MISCKTIQDMYLIEMTSSSSISFQIVIEGTIALAASISKQKIIDSQNKKIVHLLTSADGNQKVALLLTFSLI
jgi:hypothetical protein